MSRFGKPDTDCSIHSRSGYYDPQEKIEGRGLTALKLAATCSQ